MLGETLTSGDKVDGIIRFSNASHLVTRLWLEENALFAEVEAMLKDGVNLRLGLRGVGNFSSLSEAVSDNYKLITVDFWGEARGSE